MPSQQTMDLLEGLPDPFPNREYDPMMDDIYDRQGEPITMRQWVQLREFVPEYYRVALTDTGLYHVSTVWLGLDHGYGRSAPLIFESMVFANEYSYRPETEPFETESGIAFPGWPAYFYQEDHDQRRYCTEEQALAGHEELCEQIRLITEATGDIDPRMEGEARGTRREDGSPGG